jgi:hypothetical protein
MQHAVVDCYPTGSPFGWRILFNTDILYAADATDTSTLYSIAVTVEVTS